MSDEEKLFADLWMKQSDILLKATSFIPLVELAILAGWYTLLKDKMVDMAQLVAVAGAVVMFLATIYMSRTVQYVGYFRSKMGTLIAGSPRPWLGFLSGRLACLLVPILCAFMNLWLAYYSGRVVISGVSQPG